MSWVFRGYADFTEAKTNDMAKKGRTKKKKKAVDYSMSPRMSAHNSVQNFNRDRALDRFKDRFPGVGKEGRRLTMASTGQYKYTLVTESPAGRDVPLPKSK